MARTKQHYREKTASASPSPNDLTRRGLFGAGGSLLASAAAVGLAARATVVAARGQAPAVPDRPRPVFDLDHMPVDPDSGPGGTIQMAREKQFPFMTGATVARVMMKPNSSRAPHWHVNSWEVQFCVSGSCKFSIVDSEGVLHEDILKPGLVGFAPQGWLHTLDTLGNEPCLLQLCWGSPILQTQELAESLGLLPPEAVAGALGISLQQLSALSKLKQKITTNAASR